MRFGSGIFVHCEGKILPGSLAKLALIGQLINQNQSGNESAKVMANLTLNRNSFAVCRWLERTESSNFRNPFCHGQIFCDEVVSSQKQWKA